MPRKQKIYNDEPAPKRLPGGSMYEHFYYCSSCNMWVAHKYGNRCPKCNRQLRSKSINRSLNKKRDEARI